MLISFIFVIGSSEKKDLSFEEFQIEQCKKPRQNDCYEVINGQEVLVGYGSDCVCNGTACIPNPCFGDDEQ